MPGRELSVPYCSPTFLWLLHSFQINRFEWDVNKGICSVGEDGKVMMDQLLGTTYMITFRKTRKAH